MSIESTLRKAAKLAKSGDRAGAATLYRQVLAQAPGNTKARSGLAALAGGSASPGARRPAGPAPSPAQMQKLTALFQRGDLRTVLAEGKRLSLLFPKDIPLLNLLALAEARAGRHSQAIEGFDRVLALDPAQAGALVNKANSLGQLGRLDEAEQACRTALERQPDLAPAHMMLGYVLVHRHRFEDAVGQYQTAVRLAPDRVEAHLGLGNALSGLGRHDEAIGAFRAAAQRAPNNPDPAQNIANALLAMGRTDEARAQLETAVARFPRHPALRMNLVRALRELGRLPAAIEEAKAAAKLAPKHPEAWGLLATCHRDLGQTAEAIAALDRALALNPDHPQALNLRWQIEPLPVDHPDFARISALVEGPKLKAQDRAMLEFILFGALDKAGETDAAFEHLSRSKAIRHDAEPYDIAAQRRAFEALKQIFAQPPVALDAAVQAAIPAPHRPVFIVGMPRSGTSLVEQILASHSQVYGGGELTALDIAVSRFGWGKGRIGRAPDAETLASLRRDYFEALERLGVDAPVVTDKTPLNFRWLGFALAAMPEARALVLQRDARATCWSNFSHSFTGTANNFGNDMVDTAEMHLMHLDLVDFWMARFPDRIAVVPYERLTEHQEQESRKLVAAAGLDWEDACLDFHKTSRAVRTVSTDQVRQKMYTGSSQAWRRYEAHLGPMLERLDRG